MAIKLSAKRLSTVQGQAAITAAYRLEETMGNTASFEGDPSLRKLLVEDINKYPYSDDLFAIQLLVEQSRYEDRQVREEWLEKRLGDVRSPETVALYANQYTYEVSKVLLAHPWTRIEAALPGMDTRTVARLLDETYTTDPRRYGQSASGAGPKHFRVRYASTYLQRKDQHLSEVAQHGRKSIRLAIKLGQALWAPALLNLVNRRLQHVWNEEGDNELAALVAYAGAFFKREPKGLSVTLSLYDPRTFDAAEWLAKLGKEDD